MIFEWETKEERISRFMRIPPKKKLEALRQMQEFTLRFSSKRVLKLRQKLRESYF